MGDFGRRDASIEDFDASHLGTELLDGHTLAFDKDVPSAVDFWADFFKKHGIAWLGRSSNTYRKQLTGGHCSPIRSAWRGPV